MRVAAATATAALLAGSAHGAALVVSAPETLSGDGQARATVAISLAAKGRLPAPQDVLVSVDAGTVGPVRVVGDRLELELTAPHIVEEIQVSLTVRARRDPRGSGSATIRIVPPEAAVSEQATGGPYDLRLPSRLVLGRHASATISLRAPAGSPPPELLASAGALSPLEAGADGRLRATWSAPEQKFPQVAVIAALSPDGLTVDWAVIPLFGQGNVDTQTVRDANVVIRIGDESYGPVRTDAKGRARIAIAVPPGVKRGVTRATTAIGNTTEAPLDLSPPPFRRLFAVCGRGDRVHLFTVDERGAPATSDPVELASGEGKLAAPETHAPGHRVAAFAPLAGAREAEVRAALAGDEPSRASCRMALPGELPERLEVVLDRDGVAAGSGAVPVTVRLRYAGRGWRKEVRLTATVDFGTITELAPGPDGDFTATWQVPDRHDGRAGATVSVSAEGAPGVFDRETIPLRPGPPAGVVLSASERRLRADGLATMLLTARVSDRFGNPIDGVRLAGRARGTMGPFTPAGGGTYTASYRAPRAYEAIVDSIVVVVDGGTAEGRLPLHLRAARRPFSVGARAGYLTNLGKVDAPLVAADLAMRLPLLGDRISVGVDVGWYSSSQIEDVGDEPVETSVTAVPLLARITYGVDLDPIELFAGGGGGVALARAGVRSASAGERIEGGARPLVGGMLGGAVAIGRGLVFVEAAYWYAPAGGAHVVGNLGGLSFSTGYRLEL